MIERLLAPLCVLSACLLGACSRESRAIEVPTGSWERFSRIPPDEQTAISRTWYAARTPRAGLYYIELWGAITGTYSSRVESTFIVISGRMRANIGLWEGELGPGSYAVVPPGLGYQLMPLGTQRVVYLESMVPDIRRRRVAQLPSP